METSGWFIQSQSVNKKQRIVHGQGASNINHSTIVFNFDVCRLSWPVSSTNYCYNDFYVTIDKWHGGGGVLPMMAYTGRLRPTGIPFLGFRYVKG